MQLTLVGVIVLCRIPEEGLWHRQRPVADYHCSCCNLPHCPASQTLFVPHMDVCILDHFLNVVINIEQAGVCQSCCIACTRVAYTGISCSVINLQC